MAAARRMLPATLSVALVVLASVGAAAAGNGSRDTVTVAQGAGALALSSGTVVGTTSSSTRIDTSFILRARHLGNLEHRAQHTWKRPYLTTQQFAERYGQPLIVMHELEGFLGHFGITTAGYADRLDISATGTAAEFDKALKVSLQDFKVRESSPNLGGRTRVRIVHGSVRNPQLPRAIGNQVLAILGLSNYAPFASHAVPAAGRRLNQVRAAAGTGIPAGNGLAPQDFENRYDLSGLEAQGSRGQGETLGIITLASIDPSVPLAFWNKVLGLNEPPSRLTLVPIDGGAGTPSLDAGSDETDLDVEQSGAIAPQAHVRLYEAPNTDPGFADAFFAAASDNRSDTVSTSWGESETLIRADIADSSEPAAYAQAFDEAFLELAAQGQSDFAASGDSGAYDAIGDVGTVNRVVDNPGDSPYITAGGGTTLPGPQTYGIDDDSGNLLGTETVTIPAERAWGWDYLWPLYQALGSSDEATAAVSFDGGDGGGYSGIEPRPAYQRGVSDYNYRHYLSGTLVLEIAPGIWLGNAFDYYPTPSLKSAQATTGRAVPDLSTNADPQTGYAVYDPSFFPGGFSEYGGTSFVAPQLNAAAAVIDSYLHHRVGLWNPEIYRLANGPDSPFTPLNDTTDYSGVKYLSQTDADGNTTALPGNFTNDNLFYAGRPGATWNPASGLGTPDLSALARGFAQQP